MIAKIKQITVLFGLSVCLLAASTSPAFAQAATFPVSPIASQLLSARATTGQSAWVDLSQPQWQDAHYFTLVWNSYGTVSSCDVKAQQTPDQSSVSDLIADQVCTSSGVTSTSVALAAGSNYVRINLDTKTGTGTTLAILFGYRQNPYGTINVSNTPSGTQNVNLTQIGGVAVTTPLAVQGASNGVGLLAIVYCGTSTEIQGNTVVTGTTTSNLTFTMADGTTFTAKSGNRIEIHSYQIVNTGATNALITFTMDSGTPVTLGYGVAPTSTTPFGGSNVGMPTPLFTTVQNKAMSIQAGGSSTSIYVTVQGCVVP